jgi:hypothetical protein
MKVVRAAGALAIAALALPSAAAAHAGSATVACSGADYQFSNFAPGSNTVNYRVTVDDAAVAQGQFTLDRLGGTAGQVHVPLTITGAHTVDAFAWWGPTGTAHGETGGSNSVPMASQKLSCPTPTIPTPAVSPPPTPAAAAPTPAVVPTPRHGVQGTQAHPSVGIAHVAARTECSARTVRVTVTGRKISDVAFSLNGRRVTTVRAGRGAHAVSAALPMRDRRAAEVVRARVHFRNGAAARTLTARAPRCAVVAVRPQFTG